MPHFKHTARNTFFLALLALVIGFIATQAILASALSLRAQHTPIQWNPSQLVVLQKNRDFLRLKLATIPANTALEHFAHFSLSGTQLQPANILVKATLSNGTSLNLKASSDSNAERIILPITLASPLSNVLSDVQIIVHGEPLEGASILHIDLEPRPGTLSIDKLPLALQSLWHVWMSREGLNVYSAHFIVGGEKASYISSPVIAGMLWLTLSLFIGWVFTRKRLDSKAQLTAVALLTLLIWSVIDLRWQLDLWHEHGEDLNTSASALTHAVDLQAERIRRVLPSTQQRPNHRPNHRIFILSPEAFDRLRLRYALLPLNTHVETRTLDQLIPQLHVGDILILVLPQKEISTNLAHHQISSGEYTLDVNPLLAEPRLAVVTLLAIKPRETPDREAQP